MLQEIFIALTGIRSPIWTSSNAVANEDQANQFSSPSEQAMLAEIASISETNVHMRELCAIVSTQHPSLICRSVGASVYNVHLAAFIKHVIAVEAAVLKGDSKFVGGYQIVPLSTIVAQFTPWTRRLVWLLETLKYISGGSGDDMKQTPNGAQLFRYLTEELRTGYPEIETVAKALLVTGQRTWMKSLTPWLLYGQLPTHGLDDFMIRKPLPEDSIFQYQLDSKLIPCFVNQTTAHDMLGIGNALNQLANRSSDASDQISSSVALELLPSHSQRMMALRFPLSSAELDILTRQINTSISENALSRILPLPKILEMLQIVHRYVLLGDGEFTMSLIENASILTESRQHGARYAIPPRKLGRSEDISIKDFELQSVLARTWADVSNLQSTFDSEEAVFVAAKRLLRLQVLNKSSTKISRTIPATLLPTPSVLQIVLPESSSLEVFLSSADIDLYASMNAYLLSLRRAQAKLSELWKLTSHRRTHPAPAAPPFSTTRAGQRELRQRRLRQDKRFRIMRKHWSTISRCLFTFDELAAYLHGEVVRNSWDKFFTWLNKLHESKSSDARSGLLVESAPFNDPRALAQAHQKYLAGLRSGLLLDYPDFIRTISALFSLSDHFIALFRRLQTIWSGLDLQEDDGVVDAFNNYAQDEIDVLAEMSRSRSEIEEHLSQANVDIKAIEDEKNVAILANGVAHIGAEDNRSEGFVPWNGRTLDRLIMKIDFLPKSSEKQRDGDEDYFFDFDDQDNVT